MDSTAYKHSLCIICSGTGWATPKAAKLHRLCLACFGSGVVLKKKQENAIDRLIKAMLGAPL